MELGAVGLVVDDLGRCADFWRNTVGLADLGQTNNVQSLGVGDETLIELAHHPDAQTPSRRATGLFHVALLVPTRLDLARALIRLVDSGASLTGASDHIVSEALYLNDPEGNGIELYWDRPRSDWRWTTQGVEMATLPLDLDGLVATLDSTTPDQRTQSFMPPDTKIGHLHLKVSDLAQSEQWYRTLIGLDTTVVIPSATFMSANGYHHHIGINTWTSLGGPPLEHGQAGLSHLTMQLPEGDRERLLNRLVESGESVVDLDGAPAVHDPSEIRIRFTTAS